MKSVTLVEFIVNDGHLSVGQEAAGKSFQVFCNMHKSIDFICKLYVLK